MKSIHEAEIFSEHYDGQEGDSGKVRFSRWTVFLIVFLAALITIVYINNVIRVDGLLAEIHKVDKAIEFLKNENQMLRTELNYLQSPERITKIAKENLGMICIDTSPELIEKQ